MIGEMVNDNGRLLRENGRFDFGKSGHKFDGGGAKFGNVARFDVRPALDFVNRPSQEHCGRERKKGKWGWVIRTRGLGLKQVAWCDSVLGFRAWLEFHICLLLRISCPDSHGHALG